MVEISIEVEPGRTQQEVEEGYPKSLEWLDKVTDCPVCGAGLEPVEW
jgi:hypothetical protein